MTAFGFETLQGQTIDVPLFGMNQQVPDSAGPVGRLRKVINGVAKKHQRTDQGTGLRVEKRDGFTRLPTTVRDPLTGAISSKTVQNAAMLSSFGRQLVAVCAAAPFVLSEAAGCWESPLYTCPAETLRAKPIYNGGVVSKTPDSARIGSRTFYSWVDQLGGGANLTMAMLVDDDGTMVRKPFSVDSVQQVRCVTDGNQFWLVWNNGAGGLTIHAYDTNGNDMGSNSVALTAGSFFDLTKNTAAANSIVIIQKNGAAGWAFNTITWNGAAVVTAGPSFVAAFGCDTGRLAFIRNDRNDHQYYVVTIAGAGPFTYTLWPVSDSTLSVTAGPFNIAVGQPLAPFAVTGAMAPTGNADATVALSFVDNAVGSRPQTNITDMWTVTSAGVATKRRTQTALTVVSRPIRLSDGGYYVAMYYHSDPLYSINAVPQSTFYLVPLASPWTPCGRWEYGTAYADWSGTPGGATTFYMHVSTPTVAPDGGVHLPMAYRARSETSVSHVSTGKVFDFSFALHVDAVGIKDVSFGPDVGQPFEAYGELLIPGPQATAFTGSTFFEHGLPSIEVTSATAVAGGSLPASSPVQYVFVAEWTDPNGNRVRGPVSPPVNIITTAGNKTGSLGGFMLHASGKSNIIINGYRTVINQGAQSSQHYKVTAELVTDLYSGPVILNSDGALFWTLTDTMDDATAAQHEECYTDKDLLDRHACPPFSKGVAGFGRAWVIGYDGALWFSGLKTEGDALWFSPAFRVPAPSGRFVDVQAIDTYVQVFGDDGRVFLLPGNSFPDNTGAGTIPTPQPLPFTNGGTGYSARLGDGVAYSATDDDAIRLITRDLREVNFGAPVQDEIDASFGIVGLVVDGHNNVVALTAQAQLLVYNQECGSWFVWTPFTSPRLLAVHGGNLVYSDGTAIWRQTPSQAYDYDGTQRPIVTTVQVACVHLGGIRSYKRVWNAQIQGQYVGDHDLAVQAFIDDNYQAAAYTFPAFTPGAGTPYIYELPPKVELCSSLGYTITDSFPRVASGGFRLESLSFYVGLEKGLGRLPAARRLPAA